MGNAFHFRFIIKWYSSAEAMMADMEIPNDYVIYVFWQPVYLESFNLFF